MPPSLTCNLAGKAALSPASEAGNAGKYAVENRMICSIIIARATEQDQRQCPSLWKRETAPCRKVAKNPHFASFGDNLVMATAVPRDETPFRAAARLCAAAAGFSGVYACHLPFAGDIHRVPSERCAERSKRSSAQRSAPSRACHHPVPSASFLPMPITDVPILSRILRPLTGGFRDELLQAVRWASKRSRRRSALIMN